MQEGTKVAHSVAPVQIYVDRFTQRAIDDQFINITHGKSVVRFPEADIPVISSMPSVARRDSRENVLRDYRDSDVGFDFSGNTRRHIHRQSSLLGPSTNAYSRPRQIQRQQQEEPTYAYTPPRQPIQQQGREHTIYQEPHPYLRAQSSIINTRISHEVHASFLQL
jgi:hypothetical protein